VLGSELGPEGVGGVRGAPEADADVGASRGERGGDRPSDPGSPSGDDRAQTDEPKLSGLRVQWLVAGRRYPSAPPANGCRAAGVSASTLSMLGSPFSARAIAIFTAS
jgi:hypothetical protein